MGTHLYGDKLLKWGEVCCKYCLNVTYLLPFDTCKPILFSLK